MLIFPYGRALRPSFPSFAAYAYAATVAELLLVLFGWTVVALPFLVLYAGLAAATSYLQERPGPLASLALPGGRSLAFYQPRHERP